MTESRQLQISLWVTKEGLHYNSCKFHSSTRQFLPLNRNSCVQSDAKFMHDWQRPRLQLQAVNEWFLFLLNRIPVHYFSQIVNFFLQLYFMFHVNIWESSALDYFFGAIKIVKLLWLALARKVMNVKRRRHLITLLKTHFRPRNTVFCLTRKVCKSLAFGSWFTNLSRVSQHPAWVITPLNR